MELARLIEALSGATAYPYPVEYVEVCQTHISVVFLAGSCVYKIKKPVDVGFLDFSTLARRHHFCLEEVRLNRRLAAEVYLAVVPVNQAGGQISFEGAGEVIEWAVKMQRLPADGTLLQRLQHEEVDRSLVETLANRIAAFHAHADSSEQIAAYGRFEVVAANARKNFKQSEPQVGATVSLPVFRRVESLTEAALSRLQPLIDSRAQRGIPRDTHGDLHLDHIYYFPERQPPSDLIIIDCIEFNERFRFGDPVSDMAFLVMDLAFRGRRDLARVFADSYFCASGDEEGRALMAYYTAYRAVVRGKVEGLKSVEMEVSSAEREQAITQARAHWLLALAELEKPSRKPCLILMGGLPGTGKSTVARGLGEQAGFTVIRSDIVRKELAGIIPKDQAADKRIYTPEWTDRTYAKCLRQAEQILYDGGRALVDASFIAEDRRRAFLDVAARSGVSAAFLVCCTDSDTARHRIHERRGDASDADWSIHQLAAERWEPLGPQTKRASLEIPNLGTVQEAVELALRYLRSLDLQDECMPISAEAPTDSRSGRDSRPSAMDA